MPGAARLLDPHQCPLIDPGPKPHVGIIITTASPDVMINGLPAARAGDPAACVGAVNKIANGSATVFINQKAAARMGDMTEHGGTILAGSPNVIIGG